MSLKTMDSDRKTWQIYQNGLLGTYGYVAAIYICFKDLCQKENGYFCSVYLEKHSGFLSN